MEAVLTRSFIPLSAYEIQENSVCYIVKLKGGKTALLPKKIVLDSQMSWLIGLWVGDNFGSRTGTKINSNGMRSSGRFGIINNEPDLVKRSISVMRKQNLHALRLDVIVPPNTMVNRKKLINETQKKFNINRQYIRIYSGSPWRRNIGYAIYVNNTSILRVFHKVYCNLGEYIKKRHIDTKSFVGGIFDAEGDIDKANKQAGITNKDSYVVRLIEMCLTALKIKYKTRVDGGRIRFAIKGEDLAKFNKIVEFVSPSKRKALVDLLNGNCLRACDLEYLEKFSAALKNGASIKQISREFSIPEPTAKLVLRNLASGNLLKKKKIGKYYVYTSWQMRN